MFTVVVDAAPVARSLLALRVLLGDLSSAWRQIGADVVTATVPFVPTKSGALVASLKAAGGRDGVDVSAGGGSVVYAGVQNFGWPARNIEASRFMDRAQSAAETEAPRELESEIQSLIRRVGLN